MTTDRRFRSSLALVVLVSCVLSVEVAWSQDQAREATQILEATGTKGGLILHVGCGDGRLTAALGASDQFLVHGLDTEAENIRKARAYIQSLGVYGRLSVDALEGQRLPYVEDLANLIVVEDGNALEMNEVMRVLCPRGTAYIKQNGRWTKTVKPYPGGMDEWSHFLHDASGNAVANDEQIGPPKRLRWVAGPRRCRSHEFPSSVAAIVTSGGRLFTIFDEGPVGVYEKLPQQSKLVARDAANGLVLWKVPMQDWGPEFGTGIGNRWNIHHTIPRRLVADGERVYVTLRFLDSPISILDAGTGEILTEALEGTEGTDEMTLSDDVLIVKITKQRSVPATARMTPNELDDTLAAIDVNTGCQLWRRENARVMPYVLSAQAGHVVYHNMEELVCLDTKTGQQLWRTPNVIRSTFGAVSTLVLHDGVALFHGQGDTQQTTKKSKPAYYLTALSLDDGRVLWQRKGHGGQAAACTQPSDLFVVDGTVWCGGSLEGYDLHTGQVKQTLSLGKLISPGHHYRCHRSKATSRFLIWPKRGAEFVDLRGDNHMRNDWLRAPCFTGLTPANGLLYVPPSQCFCYPGAKVFGFLALSADPADELKPVGGAALKRGPAWGKVSTGSGVSSADWPMYRRDIRRSGGTQMAIPAELSPRWEIGLTCQGSQAVVMGDRLWVAEKDAHRIRCLDATRGRDIWNFTAGGRIDSAPTVWEGRVLFGCRDGSVYCLRARDGAMVWRFHVASDNRRLVSYGQLESVWPVQGSVLVQNGVVYFAAGRSSFLDGGIMVYALDAATGQVLHHHHLEGPWPDIKEDVGSPFAMEGALPDLLVSDGENLYMQRIKFDARLNRLETKQGSSLGDLDMGANHLVATGGFLDDTGFDRLYWMYGRRWPGFYFAQHAPKSGQLVVFDDSTVYAVKYFYRRIQWSPAFIPGEQGYLLFADAIDNEPTLLEKHSKEAGLEWLPSAAYADKYRRGGQSVEKGTGYVREQPPKWQEMIALRIRAMVLVGDHLFVAGAPDIVDDKDPLAAFEGRKGGLLQVFSVEDGSLLKSYPLSSLPAFDGLSAAGGRLYLATRDRKLICFAAATGALASRSKVLSNTMQGGSSSTHVRGRTNLSAP